MIVAQTFGWSWAKWRTGCFHDIQSASNRLFSFMYTAVTMLTSIQQSTWAIDKACSRQQSSIEQKLLYTYVEAILIFQIHSEGKLTLRNVVPIMKMGLPSFELCGVCVGCCRFGMVALSTEHDSELSVFSDVAILYRIDMCMTLMDIDIDAYSLQGFLSH